MAPLKMHIKLRLVDGPEGRRLRTRQAAAIREALRWFAAQHDHDSPDQPSRGIQPGPAEG